MATVASSLPRRRRTPAPSGARWTPRQSRPQRCAGTHRGDAPHRAREPCRRRRRIGGKDRPWIAVEGGHDQFQTPLHANERQLASGLRRSRPPPQLARGDRGAPRALDEKAFGISHARCYTTAAITSWTAARRSGSSVSGPATAARHASRMGNAARNQASGRHEQPRTRHLGEAAVAQAAQTAAESHQVGGRVGLDPTLVGDDPALEIGRREVEIERDEALPSARLQILEDVLVAGVVGDDHLESGRRFHQLTGLVDRQDAPVVGQRMDHHHDVLPRLHNLIQVAERPGPHRPRQRSILPDGFRGPDEVAADEIAGSEVFVTGDRHERPSQTPGHVLDEPRLSAPSRSLEHHGEIPPVARLEDGDLIADWKVEGLLDRRQSDAVVVGAGTVDAPRQRSCLTLPGSAPESALRAPAGRPDAQRGRRSPRGTARHRR